MELQVCFRCDGKDPRKRNSAKPWRTNRLKKEDRKAVPNSGN